MTPGLPPARLGDRSLFPDREPAAYLAHAAVSPPSLAARRAVIAHLGDLARRGAGAFGAAVEQRARLRSKLAAFLNAPEGTVALAQNTSVGVTDIALSIPWCAGNRVVLFRGEFPANVTPWQRAAALFSLEIVWCDADLWRTDPDAARAQLSDALSYGARVVAVSAVQFQTGHRMPLRELSDLAHAAGAELFVDAIQGLGAVPIDVEADGVDHLASGGHKWLMGVEGAGLLYARRPELHAPHLAGWLSHTEAFSFLSEGAGRLRYDRAFRDDALRFEGARPTRRATSRWRRASTSSRRSRPRRSTRTRTRTSTRSKRRWWSAASPASARRTRRVARASCRCCRPRGARRARDAARARGAGRGHVVPRRVPPLRAALAERRRARGARGARRGG
ncbi:MAG: aminotransferase class V-fold PLP-dependent enzyme [Polyangiales bacterium]